MTLSNFDIEKFEKVVGANGLCPACGSKHGKMLLLDTDENTTVLSTTSGYVLPTYSFFCTNCGAIRQFVRTLVDEKMAAEEEQ